MATPNSTIVEKLGPLVDLDVVVYRSGFAADSQVRKDLMKKHGLTRQEADEQLKVTDYESFALGNTKSVIAEIRSKFRGPYRGFLTGDGNFREQIATILPYKGNRVHSKPKYYKSIKDYLITYHDAEVVHGREADDAIATAQWAAKDRSTIICSIDKDLDMVPGWHYNWMHNEIYNVPLAYANMRLFYQMLEGDRVDNIPGINGVGTKTIAALFETCQSIEDYRDVVQKEYQRYYGENWREAYEEVARLLWMERIEGRECPFLY